MIALMTLFALAVGFAVLGIVAVVGMALLKVTFKVIFLPLKLLLLPFILVAVVVKLVLIFAFGVTLFALFIPVAIVGMLLLAPFLVLGAAVR